jgi:hypothetical protein
MLAVPTLASAQLGFDSQFHFGYYASSRYTTKAGVGATNEGLEFGADIPILPKIPLGPGLGAMTIAFSPSVDLLGSVSKGSATGQVYRGLISAQAPIPQTGLYGRFGVGFGYATGNSNVFSSKTAYEIDYTLGLPIFTKLPVFSLSAEVTYHQSSQGTIGGWTLGVAGKF